MSTPLPRSSPPPSPGLDPSSHPLRRCVRTLVLSALALAPAAVPPVAAQVEDEPLTLRVHDAVGLPGNVVVLSVRTYAPKPISQGQLCLRSFSVPTSASGEPFAQVESALVFSSTGDATFVEPTIVQQGDDQILTLPFESPAAAINDADGPIAAIYLRLADTVTAGQVFPLDLDLSDTFLLDAAGDPIATEVRPGELTIRGPADPFELGAEGDRVLAGETALLSVQTAELLPWLEGTVVLQYPVAAAAGPPVVSIDPRFGNTSFFEVTEDPPGTLTIDFESADGTLNQLPGDVIQIALPTTTAAADSSIWPVQIVAAQTTILSDTGTLALDIEAGELEFEVATILVDGFENGNLSGWN